MYSVWKFPLEVEEYQAIEVPLHSKILSVESQGNDIVVYALVNEEQKEKEYKDFRVYGTGHTIPEVITDYQFLGTVKLMGDSLMFHAFYK